MFRETELAPRPVARGQYSSRSGSFELPLRATDGSRIVSADVVAARPEPLRVFRGGGYSRLFASPTAARYQTHLSRAFDIGLRPSKPVDWAASEVDGSTAKPN